MVDELFRQVIGPRFVLLINALEREVGPEVSVNDRTVPDVCEIRYREIETAPYPIYPNLHAHFQAAVPS